MSESLMQGGEAAESTTEQPQASSETNPIEDRPEWLPEKYKTGEDLANAYKALESKLGAKEEDIRKAIMGEIEAEAFKDRPEKAGDYQLPDMVDESLAVDNELLQWWSDHAFENGYSQEEFQKGIEMYAQAVQGAEPDLEAEAKRLGDNANERINAASAFAMKMFSEEQIPAIERLFQSADGVMVMETIMEAMKDGSFSGETQPQSRITEDELRSMMRDERYSNPVMRDPAYVKKIEEGWRQIYG